MAENYEIDTTDRKILKLLQEDARTPFVEIARKLIVSGGTIHQRVDRLKKMGIIKGSKIEVDFQKLGFDVTVFLGIHMNNTRDLSFVIKELKEFREVIEVHYTTGNYALLIKVQTKTIQDFHQFLANKLQTIDSIQSTESFISLDTPLVRDVSLD